MRAFGYIPTNGLPMEKSQYIILGVASVVIVGSAYVHGVATDRWVKKHSEKLSQYTARLDAVPTEFGDWVSTPQEVDAEQFEASGCDGHFSRLFENKLTGDQISVFLVSGRGYHATIHTPQFCYKAAGFDQRADAVPYEFEIPAMTDKHEVVHALFKKDTARETSHLRILWTYAVDGPWRSPRLAKYTYGGEDAMYKLYLIRSVESGVPDIGSDPSISFAKEFLSVLDKALFSQSVPSVPEDSSVEG